MTPRHFIATTLAAASLLVAPGAMAQQQAQTLPEIAAEDVSRGQVASFVNAMIAVEKVRNQYMPKIEAAETQQERQELASQADTAARAAVDDVAGISPDEYLAIGRAAQNSEDLVKQINERFATLRSNRNSGTGLQQTAPEAQGDTAQE